MNNGLCFTIVLLCVTLQILPDALGQDYTRWNLPEGAIMRLGKGTTHDIAYSPDGTRLAVASGIGVWLYDAHTGAEITLLKTQPVGVRSVAFSPDGNTLAGGSLDNVTSESLDTTVWLWDVNSGEN